MNVGSIADKYFSDTMVEAKKIKDDNTDHIVLSTFSFGGLTILDGHAIATINILKPKENPNMRILLDQDDIQNALNDFVKGLSIPNADKATVELGIENDEIVAEVVMGDAPVKNKGGRPRKARAKSTTTTKEEVTDAPEESADSGDEGIGTDTDSRSGNSATPDVEEGTKTPADKPKTDTKTTGSKSKNLFGEEENQSSESVEKKTEDSSPKKTVVKPAGKKSSIFDVD